MAWRFVNLNSMGLLLVQIKLRLLTNALRSSRSAKATFVVSTIFAALVAIGTFLLLAAFRGQAASVYVTSVIFTLFALGWLILPVFVFGLDSTLDPATLALYPLRTRPLATGLLAASATGAWPLANVIGLLGVTLGLAASPAGLIVSIIAVPLQVLFCIALARLVTTGMAGLLRSRRGKDLAVFLFIPIFALYEFFTQVVPAEAAGRKLSAASFHGLDSWLRWLPPGLAAHAIQDASDGRPGRRAPAASVAGGDHRRARLCLGPVAQPRAGYRRYHDPILASPQRRAAAGQVRPARRGHRPILDLSAP